MAGLPDLTSTWKTMVASVSLDGPAWMTVNAPVLLGVAERRGATVTVPRADGGLPRVQRADTVSGQLRMVFIGDVDRNGTAAVNPRAQLITNIDWFVDNVINATPGSDHALALKVTPPDGVERTGRIQWWGFEMGDVDTALGLNTRRASLRFELFQALTKASP